MKNVFIIILSSLCCLAAADRAAAQTVASGTTGACTWTLTGASPNYTLTISGNGAMADYAGSTAMPWFDYRTNIKTLDIQAGVTHIGNYAFYSCGLTGTLTIPNSVITVGNYAFRNCTNLTGMLTIPGSVNSSVKQQL